MEKRTKLWRRKQGFRVFKSRMKYHASCESFHNYEEGLPAAPYRWHELAKVKWAQTYRTTGTPCSCWMCRGMEYERLEYKKETRRLVLESEE